MNSQKLLLNNFQIATNAEFFGRNMLIIREHCNLQLQEILEFACIFENARLLNPRGTDFFYLCRYGKSSDHVNQVKLPPSL